MSEGQEHRSRFSLGDWIYKMILYVTLKAWKFCKSPESLWTGYFVLPLIQPYSFLNYIKTFLVGSWFKLELASLTNTMIWFMWYITQRLRRCTIFQHSLSVAAFHIAFPINSVASLVADKALLQKTNMVQMICISTSVSSANNSTICRIALASLLNKKEQELYRNLFFVYIRSCHIHWEVCCWVEAGSVRRVRFF